MNKIQEYLQAQDKILAQDREKTLISLGLYEKEYAPDGKFSRQYQKYDILNGEKRYYREVALAVSEEEWQSILAKSAAVAEIEEKERLAIQKEHKRKYGVKNDEILPRSEQAKNEEPETGRSKLAFVLRIAAGVLALLMIVSGMAAWARGYEAALLVCIGGAALSFLLLCAVAEILDRLALLTAIARNGYKIVKK